MNKEKVLKTLYSAGDYISGEKISDSLNISRAAVNGHIKNLRSEGYDISSVTNKGYRLNKIPDILNTETLGLFLNDTGRISFFDSINSTNIKLKELAANNAPEGSVVISNEQTSGRGRLGRTFESGKNVGIYLSYLMRPAGMEAISTLTARTAVMVRKAIVDAYGIDTRIKWVNDIMLNDRKAVGILTELSTESESGFINNAVIGIGVNVKKTLFPKEIENIATSLENESGRSDLLRARLAAEIIKDLDILSKEFPADSGYYLDEYRKYCISTGKDVKVINNADNTERKARSLDINPDFSLKVRFEDGTVKDIFSGEVSVRGLCGYLPD
ncbi:MAG: biotin--[acetyl-CoA-carboxylase] ligase [Clostridiales bacterium]|nr:biotin--[acetyl-CoA-carboxylase] ligase [Clostridiales bacterium]